MFLAFKFISQSPQTLRCLHCSGRQWTSFFRNTLQNKRLPRFKHVKKPLYFSLLACGIESRTYLFKQASCEKQIVPVVPIVLEKNFTPSKLWVFLKDDILALILAVIAAFGVALLNIEIPLQLGHIVNVLTRGISNNSLKDMMEEIKMPAFNLVGLYVLQAVGTLIYISLLSGVSEALAMRLRLSLFEAYMKQDIAFFDQERTGALVDCLTSDIQELKSSFKHCISQGLRNITQILGCTCSLFLISPIMSVSIFGVVASVITVGTFFGSLLRKLSKKAQMQGVKAITMSEEALSNVRTVRSFANEKKQCGDFLNEIEELRRLNTHLGYGIGVFQAGTNLFLNGIVLSTLYIGGKLMASGNLTPGHLMSFLVSTQTIQRSLGQLSLLFGSILKGKQAGERIFYYINMHPTIPISGGKRVGYHAFIPSVEFKDVTFSYPTRPNQMILSDFNLTIPAGKTVAIVGASGNGKSTIALLLERFYDAQSGFIKIGGVDIKELDPEWLRGSAIGIINQEPVLFATTVKNNIKYGKIGATDEEVVKAAELANADVFINSFPDKYETVVGEKGVTVSGGQKQRIAIARALIKNPSILILDEATSALDPESERVVQETLEKARKGRTVLIIAHRLSTIQNADIIVVLNKGIIVEMGTHDELLSKKGHYCSLMNQQRKD